MLRLWPEHLTAVVYPDGNVLYGAGGREVARYVPVARAAFDVTENLDRLLDAYPRRGRAQLDLIVSDSAARTIPLIWQDSLNNGEQYEAYARACFDQAGFNLDGDWVVQAGYRHFRSVGFGYALPRALVVEVGNRLLERRMRFRSIAPISAYAYWRNTGNVRGSRTVLILRECGRLSALLFHGRTCAGVQVQPMGAGFPDALRRLANMLDATLPAVSHLRFWTPTVDTAETELIKSRFPTSDFEVLPGLRWA